MSSEFDGLGRRGVLTSALAMLLLAACDETPEKPRRRLANPPPSTPQATEAAINLCNAAYGLGAVLLDRLVAQNPKTTVSISPVSLMFGLSVLAAGARGATQVAMADGLGFAQAKVELDGVRTACDNLDARMLDTADAACDYANGLWIDNTAGPVSAFCEGQTREPAVRVEGLDLASSGALVDINALASGTTNGALETAISEVPHGAKMLLVSTLFFRGVWNHGFEEANTKHQPFTLADGTVKQVPTMRWKGAFGYVDSRQLQSVVIPYGDQRYQMLLVMMKPGQTGSRWTDGLDLAQDTMPCEILMPRLNLAWGGDVRQALADIGLGAALGPAPDFGAAARPGVGPDHIFHRTLAAVDESTADDGPVPTATTTRSDGAAIEPFVFKADRPFYIYIRETGSGAPVLMAYVADPGGDTGW